MWIATGIAAFLAGRIVPLHRTPKWIPELAVSVIVALLMGTLATALDFGGWNEPDWRCGLLSLLGAYGAIGAMRAF